MNQHFLIVFAIQILVLEKYGLTVFSFELEHHTIMFELYERFCLPSIGRFAPSPENLTFSVLTKPFKLKNGFIGEDNSPRINACYVV